MTEKEFKMMLEIGRYFDSMAIDGYEGCWTIHGVIKTNERVYLHTARGAVREFKTLDSAFKCIKKMKGERKESLEIAIIAPW